MTLLLQILEATAELFDDPVEVLRWVTLMACLASAISGLELLAARRVYREDGALAWSMHQQRFPWMKRVGFPGSYPIFLVFPVLRVVGAVMVARLVWGAELPLPSWPIGPLCIVVAVTLFAANARQPQASGADSMEAIVWFGLAFAWFLSSNSVVVQLVLWFVALQSSLSYSSNGWHKAAIKSWRKGDVLSLFANHSLFGHPGLAAWASRGVRMRFVMSSVIVIETAFPLVLVTGLPGCWLFLGWAASFHLLNGVFMGLNAFIFGYFCTYPAILFCSLQVQNWLWGGG